MCSGQITAWGLGFKRPIEESLGLFPLKDLNALASLNEHLSQRKSWHMLRAKPDQPHSDEALIGAVLSGDKEQFRPLVTRYKDMVFSMIMRQVGDPALAEEIAQETFLKAYLSLRSFRFEARFSTWLVRIALNQTSSYFASRRFKEKQRTETFDPLLHDSACSAPGAENEEEKLISRLQTALKGLKRKFREVLVLCALEGKSYEEAAQILKVPVGTVRSRLNKARLLLQSHFLPGD